MTDLVGYQESAACLTDLPGVSKASPCRLETPVRNDLVKKIINDFVLF